MNGQEYAKAYCSECYEGEIVRGKISGALFCNRCYRTAKIREVNEI